MARGSTDRRGGSTLSSIALLQARFRQLQKIKELRQEKELLRMLSETKRSRVPPITTPSDQSGSKAFLAGPESTVFLPPDEQPHCRLSLSLWPGSQSKINSGSQGIQAPSNLAKSQFNDASLVSTSPGKLGSFYPDIDTSLRL